MDPSSTVPPDAAAPNGAGAPKPAPAAATATATENPPRSLRAIDDWMRRRASRKLLAASVLTVVVFIIDLLMPRTAAPAIFYTGVLALVASSGELTLIIPAALLLTAFTWIGCIFEPAGGPIWVSVVDRAIVTGVLWLTAMLVLERERDVRELAKLSRELSRRNNELDQFAGVVAHDIRSPLATAMLYAELLAEPEMDREEDEKRRAVVVRSLTEMSNLIQDLLEATRRPQRDADCDADAVVECVLRTMEAEIRGAGDARVTREPLPRVRADEAQVRQVFQNLIQNSIKYRANRPLHIHVSATRRQDHWEFCVRDNGIGVKPQEASLIFERFGRGSVGRASGVGLGLSVCKRIIEQHGGRIWVEPAGDASGGGAAFRFTLPAIDATNVQQ